MVIALVIVAVLALFGLIDFVITRTWIKVAKAGEAMVVSGKKSRDSEDSAPITVIIGGKKMVNPITQRYDIISLRSRQVMMTAVA